LYRRFLQDCIITGVIASFLVLTLILRGAGWDGDSITNIAQFEKIIHPALFGTLDGGTAPKLMPIALYGGFHWITGSYDIHWITIFLTAYSIARLVRLPVENGGGPMWLALPFISIAWIQLVLSADNQALALPFLILALVDLVEKNQIAELYFYYWPSLAGQGRPLLY
jgi:hypothetical protein